MLMLSFAGGGGDHHLQECEEGSKRQVVRLSCTMYMARSLKTHDKFFCSECLAASST